MYIYLEMLLPQVVQTMQVFLLIEPVLDICHTTAIWLGILVLRKAHQVLSISV